MKLLLLMIIPHLSLQAFEYRETSPGYLFHYRCAIGDPSPLGNHLNPSFIPLLQTYYLSTSYSKPYTLDEINAGTVAGGYSDGKKGIGVSWNSFGITEYREQTWEAAVGYRVLPYLAAGLGSALYHLRIRTDAVSVNSYMSDLYSAVLFTPFDFLQFSFIQDNIRSLADPGRKDLLYPSWCGAIQVTPVEGVHCIWNIGRTYYGYRNSISASVNLLSFIIVNAGYARETAACSMSIIILYRRFRISYGMEYHSMLGTTHSIGITISGTPLKAVPVKFPSVGRREPHYDPPDKPVDINRCSLDELRSLPVVTEEIAVRLVRYRELVGPITLKSLYQVGLSEKEVMILQNYLCGLAPDTKPHPGKAIMKHGRERKPGGGYGTAKRKELFQKLLDAGVPSGTAIRICDLAAKHGLKELKVLVGSMEGIPSHIKETIVRTCNDVLR